MPVRRYDCAAVGILLTFAEGLSGAKRCRSTSRGSRQADPQPLDRRSLKPLAEHWSLIRCPACGGSSTRPANPARRHAHEARRDHLRPADLRAVSPCGR